GCRTSRSALRWSSLLLRRAPQRSRLLRRLLPSGSRTRWILTEPAMFVRTKWLGRPYIGGRRYCIIGLANIALPHQILAEICPTQILRSDVNCARNVRRANEHTRPHLIFRNGATNCRRNKCRFDAWVYGKAAVVQDYGFINDHGLAKEDRLG